MSSWEAHVLPHGPLEKLDDRLWQVTGTMRGIPLPRNMLIYKMNDGGLLIHSAIALNPAGMTALEALGPVKIILVPSGFHRLNARVYRERFPDALVVCPAKVRSKVAEKVKVDATCEAALPPRGVRVVQPDGTRGLELVYDLPLAAGGSALAFCDVMFNLPEHYKGFVGFVFRYLTRSTGHFGVTRIARMFLVKDVTRFRMWLEAHAARYDLKIVTMAHGAAVLNPREKLLEAARGLGGAAPEPEAEPAHSAPAAHGAADHHH